ncbi:MAG: hypothetical protein MJ072_06830, partial [Clostridia bacterium]|nr:hypothetical protein [Clostridia bacterium]
MEIRTSDNLIDWSEPSFIAENGKKFGNHYQAGMSFHAEDNPYYEKNGKFTVLHCHNGTDVKAVDFKITKK